MFSQSEKGEFFSLLSNSLDTSLMDFGYTTLMSSLWVWMERRSQDTEEELLKNGTLM